MSECSGTNGHALVIPHHASRRRAALHAVRCMESLLPKPLSCCIPFVYAITGSRLHQANRTPASYRPLPAAGPPHRSPPGAAAASAAAASAAASSSSCAKMLSISRCSSVGASRTNTRDGALRALSARATADRSLERLARGEAGGQQAAGAGVAGGLQPAGSKRRRQHPQCHVAVGATPAPVPSTPARALAPQLALQGRRVAGAAVPLDEGLQVIWRHAHLLLEGLVVVG